MTSVVGMVECTDVQNTIPASVQTDKVCEEVAGPVTP